VRANAQIFMDHGALTPQLSAEIYGVERFVYASECGIYDRHVEYPDLSAIFIAVLSGVLWGLEEKNPLLPDYKLTLFSI
jgi:hypothetical protein